MIWGFISASGVEDLLKINEIMNEKKTKEKKSQILIHQASDWQRLYFLAWWDPKHTDIELNVYLDRKTAESRI